MDTGIHRISRVDGLVNPLSYSTRAEEDIGLATIMAMKDGTMQLIDRIPDMTGAYYGTD